MSDTMPKGQKAFIDSLYTYVKEATNMTDTQAYEFSFRAWQIRDHLKSTLAPRLAIDTDTGLVNCGCGGTPIAEDWEWEGDTGLWECWCNKCRLRTGFYSSQQKAMAAWNRAMGMARPDDELNTAEHKS